MNVHDVAEIIEEYKYGASSAEVALIIARKINDEWFYQRKGTCEVIIE